MKIIITGGAGFIGSNLAEFLIKKEFEILIIDNLSSGKFSNIENFIDKVSFVNQSLEDTDLNTFGHIDAIIHLASQVSVPVSISDFKSSSLMNLSCSINVVDYCSSKNIPLIYASSSAVYGGLDFGDDSINEVNLLSPYAVDKYALELYSITAHKLHQLSSIGLRFYNVYGPKQDPNNEYSGVISIFLDRLIEEKSININGGLQTRDFIYVDDVVNSIYKSLLIAKQNLVCEQINILTGSSITIDNLADILIRQLNSKGKKIYREMSKGDPKHSKGSTKKMMTFLKFSLEEMVSLDIGLEKTIKFVKNK